jgi:hypothetical protein
MTNLTHANVDWTQLMAQATFEGGQAFLKTIGNADPTLTEAQIQADEQQVDRRYVRALDYAKRDRGNVGPHILSTVRNWARKQALSILREKIAGKPIRSDFYQPFQFDLQQEVAALISDIQVFWKQEDEQRAAAEQQRQAAIRKEGEQAFRDVYPLVTGLQNALLDGERQRQTIFESGQHVVQQWADKYGESVREREKQLGEREKRIQEEERENREHQRALRALMIRDEKVSYADNVIRVGGKTLGCFFWLIVGGAVIFFGLYLALFFAFPHH